MSYQEKIFVAYDGPNDQNTYNELTKMIQSDNSSFLFYSAAELHKRLDKDSDEVLKEKIYNLMSGSKVCLVLVGKTTKTFRRFIKWQIERALNTNMPIIMVNPNNIRTVDFDRCPTLMKKNLALHVSMQAEIIEFALLNFPASHAKHREAEFNSPLRYAQSVYEGLNLFTSDL